MDCSAGTAAGRLCTEGESLLYRQHSAQHAPVAGWQGRADGLRWRVCRNGLWAGDKPQAAPTPLMSPVLQHTHTPMRRAAPARSCCS